MKAPKLLSAVFYFADKFYEKGKVKSEKEHKRISQENKEAFEKAWLEKYHGGVKPKHWDFDEGET